MKNIALLLICLMACGLVQAQDRFIEFEISRSMTMMPSEVTYKFSAKKSMNFLGMTIPMDDEEDEEEGKKPDLLADVQKELKSAGFEAERKPANPLKIEKGGSEEAVFVTVNSMAALDKVVATGSRVEGINGSVHAAEHKMDEAALGAFYSSLKADAIKEARVIAGSMDVELGELISMSEAGSSMMNMDMTQYMKTLSKQMLSGDGGGNATREESRTFRFRYAIK